METKNTIQTDAEFLGKVDELVKMRTKNAARKAKRDAAVQALQAKYADVEAAEAAEKELLKALLEYITQPGANKRLLPAGKKTGHTAMATFSLKTGQPAIALLEGRKDEEVIELIQQNEKTAWLNPGKVTLNKSAIAEAGLSADELAKWGLTYKVGVSLTVKAKGSK